MNYSLKLTGHARAGLRFGKKKPVFREKIQKWMCENVGIHGIDWHIHVDPTWTEEHKKRLTALRTNPDSVNMWDYPPTYILRCEKSKAMLFKLTWM